ncbi:MAG: type VII secretion protein EssB [Erysipelotrichaceae bacterium]|nr:type VII secretion protein EssB [Erysipelotrichaceae bacterium]
MKEKIIEFTLEEIHGNHEVALTLLKGDNSYFINSNIVKTEEGVSLIFTYEEEQYFTWDDAMEMGKDERIRLLLNIWNIFPDLKQTFFTYEMKPENLLFDRNGLPRLLSKGIQNQVPPYEPIMEGEFITLYKAMIVALVDKKKSFQELMDGQLDFYKSTLFAEKIIKATTLDEIKVLLEEEYKKEKQNSVTYLTVVPKKFVTLLKAVTAIGSFMTILGCAISGYILLDTLPKERNISNIRQAFINNNYSDVITLAKKVDSKKISQDDKYLIAYSTIMTEPLTAAQKTELSKISTQSSEAYLRYWIMIGQQNIDEAINIASYLDDPQLMMYGLTKKIDDVQRDPSLSAEERTSTINDLKNKLDELKKKYLLPEGKQE